MDFCWYTTNGNCLIAIFHFSQVVTLPCQRKNWGGHFLPACCRSADDYDGQANGNSNNGELGALASFSKVFLL